MTIHTSTSTPADRVTRFADLGGELTGNSDNRAPLVLLPGLTFDRSIWRTVRDELARVDPERRVLTLDLPGQGDSVDVAPRPMTQMVGLLRQAVDAAELESPVLVGHSMSGGLVSMYAASHPATGVVNVDSPPDLRPVAALLQSLTEQIRGDGLDQVWQMMAESFHVELLSPANRELVRSSSRFDSEVVRSYWSELLDTTLDDIQRMVDEAMSGLTAAGVPYLLILGTPMPEAAVAAIERQLPYATVETWPGGGHFPHLAHLSRFADILSGSANWRPGIRPAIPLSDREAGGRR